VRYIAVIEVIDIIEVGCDVPDHGAPTAHVPELILNHFNTRLGETHTNTYPYLPLLGRRTARVLASLFPQVIKKQLSLK